MTEPWPQTLTKIQGQLIAHHRERRGLRHAELVARVNELGLDLKRTTLVNIEQGRRKALTVPEVFAFAYALQMPPILLLAPVGNVDLVEVLRGKNVSPWIVARWIEGKALLDAPADGIISADDPLREQFDALLSHGEILMWHRFLDDLQLEVISLEHRQAAEYTAARQKDIENKILQIQSWRDRIRSVGLIAPPQWEIFVDVHPEVK